MLKLGSIRGKSSQAELLFAIKAQGVIGVSRQDIQVRRKRGVANHGQGVDHLLLQTRQCRVGQTKTFDVRSIDLDGQIGRQPKGHLETVQTRFETGLARQQRTLGVVKGLARLIDLQSVADAACVEGGIQLREAVPQLRNVGLLVPNSLNGLQQTEETADPGSPSAARGKTGHQAGGGKPSPSPRRPGGGVSSRHHFQKEALPKLSHAPCVDQQVPLRLREPFPINAFAGSTQHRLGQCEIGKGPAKTGGPIGKVKGQPARNRCHPRGARSRNPTQTRTNRRDTIHFIVIGGTLRLDCAFGKSLGIQAKSLIGHVQGGKIQVFLLTLKIRGMGQGQLDHGRQIQVHPTISVQGQPIPPNVALQFCRGVSFRIKVFSQNGGSHGTGGRIIGWKRRKIQPGRIAQTRGLVGIYTELGNVLKQSPDVSVGALPIGATPASRQKAGNAKRQDDTGNHRGDLCKRVCRRSRYYGRVDCGQAQG